MTHARAKLDLQTAREAADFVKRINSDNTTDKWMLENFDGTLCVNARSLFGVIYASAEWNGEIYLFNASDENAAIPSFIDQYRA